MLYHAIIYLSKVATTVHVRTGQELLSDESFDESVLMVSKGQLEIRADLTLTERLYIYICMCTHSIYYLM